MPSDVPSAPDAVWCCASSRAALCTVKAVLGLFHETVRAFSSDSEVFEALEKAPVPPATLVFFGEGLTGSLAVAGETLDLCRRVLLCSSLPSDGEAGMIPLRRAVLSHARPADLVHTIALMKSQDQASGPAAPPPGTPPGKHQAANAAARRLLEMEAAYVQGGNKPGEPPPVSLPFNTQVLRQRLWHFWKNLLQRRASDASLDPLVQEAGRHLAVWEDCCGQGTGHARQLATVLALVEAGAFQEAADLAWKIYYQQAGANPTPNQPHAMNTEAAAGPERNRFDILIVDDSPQDLALAQSALQRLCDGCREFAVHLELVDPANAYDDALIRLGRNPLTQAVVVDWDLRSGQKTAGTSETGARLVQSIQRDWPGVYTCLLTGRGAIEVTAQNPSLGARAFSKQDLQSFEEIFADICEAIRRRRETPLFSALKAYANRPVSVFHALATSRAKAVKKSRWVHEFLDFYGDHVFLAETSTTLPPLDSLLDPKGSIHQAQEHAARVFGADRTFFVTNGTSTANKIIHQALLQPGDEVLLDRTCHKSHHYALALTGAKPVYLKAEPVTVEGKFTGIFKGIPLQEILAKLRAHPAARMLCLTNCTFDGYTHDVRKIMKEVRRELAALRGGGVQATDPDEFVFLFDEAWFAFARFLPPLRPFTALFACRDSGLASARVYVTQSTHKTLIAFRQASMIHVRDPRFSRHQYAFKEAIYTHSTTSPSYNLLASLDVGRMQADLEGHQLFSEAWHYAATFRQWAASLPAADNEVDRLVNKYFLVLTPDAMGTHAPAVSSKGRLPQTGGPTDGTGPEFALDQTKITVFLRPESGLTGNAFRKFLLDLTDIQFNKTTHNTVLLMVNGGSTESSIAHLMFALRTLAQRLEKERLPERENHAEERVFNDEPSFHRGHSVLRDFFYGHREPGQKVEPEEIGFDEALQHLRAGGSVVSATFVIPYPPGFPILVPGQVVEAVDLEYLKGLGESEIHGIIHTGRLSAWRIDPGKDAPATAS